MRPLSLDAFAASARSVLCLGAHPDDIEIGCGGTLLRLRQQNPALEIRWLVLCADASRRREALDAAARFLGPVPEKQVEVLDFEDGFLPSQARRAKQVFEALKQSVAPDLILTHYRGDLHQDHRLVCELTWQTFRDHWILEYEIPKYDGDLGHPNLFVPLPEALVARKIEHLLAAFPSQRARPWFREESFRALLRLRAIECRAATGFAEAFHARKLVLDAPADGDA